MSGACRRGRCIGSRDGRSREIVREQGRVTSRGRVGIATLGEMSVTARSLPLWGLGLVALAGCSTTAVSSSLPAATTTTVPVTTTTVAPTTTAAPTTTVPVTTTAAPTTTVPVTTTTVPSNIVEVPALEVQLAAVGTRSGGETSRVQERLLELGFWLQSADGNYGLTTRQAVMAFQKYLGLNASGAVDDATAAYLSNLTERGRGRADAGTLVEVDKTRQLLFFVIDGNTEWILNTSTGTEIPYEKPNKNDPTKIERGTSVTPVGLHYVNRERPEGWWEGDLGEIYRPKYFVGGVAVHGSNSIPNYPASHGCVRVSVPAMDFIWDSGLVPMNTPVWVHGEIPA
jgi:peptidoglycan hydrolase-like protein with peptidoglycan-binding domain